MNTASRAVLATILVTSLGACSSIESTHLVRDQHGITRGEKFDGVPMVLTVADRLGFLVTEAVYEVTREVTKADGTVTQKVARETVTTMSDKPIPLGRSEVFTVDPRRPASGTSDATIELENQGIKKISNKVTDTTITDLADALVKTKDAFKPESGETTGEIKRVLISQRQYMLVYDPGTGRFTPM